MKVSVGNAFAAKQATQRLDLRCQVPTIGSGSISNSLQFISHCPFQTLSATLGIREEADLQARFFDSMVELDLVGKLVPLLRDA